MVKKLTAICCHTRGTENVVLQNTVSGSFVSCSYSVRLGTIIL